MRPFLPLLPLPLSLSLILLLAAVPAVAHDWQSMRAEYAAEFAIANSILNWRNSGMKRILPTIASILALQFLLQPFAQAAGQQTEDWQRYLISAPDVVYPAVIERTGIHAGAWLVLARLQLTD